MANQMIKNMRQDELRNLSNQQQNSININTTNTNISTSNKHLGHNYRYKERLNNSQSITDNIGILYQNNIPDKAVSTTDIKIQYHNLLIYSKDRKWILDTSDTFYSLKIYLGSNQSNTHKNHIQISNSFQNIITLYSPLVIIPNIFTHLNESPPTFIHIKINNYTLSTSSNNSKTMVLYLQNNTVKSPLFLHYKCMEKDLLALENNINDRLDFTSGLAIDILNQYGNELCNNIQDKIKIKTIVYNIDTQLIDIYFNGYLIPNIWQVNNTVVIKNYVFRETELEYEECYQWNEFINRKEGHKIVSLDNLLINKNSNTKNTSDKHNYNLKNKCQKISIEAPFTFNQQTGEIVIPEWFNNFLLKTNIDTLPNVNQEYKGAILNIDLQTIIDLQIVTANNELQKIDFKNITINSQLNTNN